MRARVKLRPKGHPVNCFIVWATDANNIPTDEITVNSECLEYLKRLMRAKWNRGFSRLDRYKGFACVFH